MQNIVNIKGKTALGLDANLGALVCYVGNIFMSLGLIYSIIVVATDKTNKLARFHAWQSILCSAVGLVFATVVVVAAAVASIVDVMLGFPLLSLVIGLTALVGGLVLFVMYIRAAIKAYNGETYKITLIGNYAERWA